MNDRKPPKPRYTHQPGAIHAFEERRDIAKALGKARDGLQQCGYPAPSGPDIIFQVIKDQVDTDRRIPDRDGPRQIGNAWVDYTHTVEERLDAAQQRRIDEAEGDDSTELWGIQLTATPEEVAIMHSVLKVFPSYMHERNARRDFKILWRLASGHSLRRVGREFGMSHTAVRKIRRKRCTEIWSQVQFLMPSVRRRTRTSIG